MAETAEIVLPEDKPAWEWVRGRALQKVSPKWTHARLQFLLATALAQWAQEKGRVGPEWRFRVTPPGEVTRPLVPDVAYLSYYRLAADAEEAAEEPLMAPDIAVEILSPGDRRINVDHKIEVYLAAGSALVMIVDPKRAVIEAHAPKVRTECRFDDDFTHIALPGFTLNLAKFLREK